MSEPDFKLQDCPFCGEVQQAIAEESAIWVRADGNEEQFYVVCETCDAMGPTALSAKQAANLWNRREKRP